METIFIERRGCQISIDNKRLRITNAKQKLDTSFPLTQLRAIIICCECVLSASLLRNLAKHEIALVCFHPNDIDATFINVPATHGNVIRRINQYAITQNFDLMDSLARLIVRQKIRQQQNLLLRLRNEKLDKRTELSAALLQFPTLPIKGNVSQLLGVEGAAARAYFTGLTHVFAPNLKFKGRVKRPATDCVNATLSLTYTLLTFEAERAIIAAGFDPMLGILHQAKYNRASLACDLVELIRTKADEWIIELFATQTLRENHFAIKENKAHYLGKAGREIYFTHLMVKMPIWRARLRNLARKFARKLEQQSATEQVVSLF